MEKGKRRYKNKLPEKLRGEIKAHIFIVLKSISLIENSHGSQ